MRQLAGVLTGMLGNLSVLTDGVNQLAAQYVQLDNGLNAYTDGVAQLKAGVAQLAEGAAQLTGGTGELRSSVSGIDMDAQLDSLLNSLSGGGRCRASPRQRTPRWARCSLRCRPLPSRPRPRLPSRNQRL